MEQSSILTVCVWGENTSLAGHVARSFDPSDSQENLDDYQLFKGTEADLREIGEIYFGRGDQFGARVHEAILEALA